MNRCGWVRHITRASQFLYPSIEATSFHEGVAPNESNGCGKESDRRVWQMFEVMTSNVPWGGNKTVRSAVKRLIRDSGINNEGAYFGRDKLFKILTAVKATEKTLTLWVLCAIWKERVKKCTWKREASKASQLEHGMHSKNGIPWQMNFFLLQWKTCADLTCTLT